MPEHNRRFSRRRGRNPRWTAQRQYALRCRERGFQTPPSVIAGHYMNLTGRRWNIPCGCASCLAFEVGLFADGFRPWFMTPPGVSRETDAPLP